MKKKSLALLLCALVLMSLVACGGSGDSTTDKQDNASGNSNGSDSQDSSGENTNQDDSSAINPDTFKNDNVSDSNGKELTFEEVTVVDNDECTIKITGIDPNNIWGYTLKCYLENKSSDKTYMFSVDRSSVNGVQCDPLFATEVSPEKKSNKEISYTTTMFDNIGITEYTDVELSFRVYDTNDWSADSVAEETIHIYPYGEENATQYVREAQPDDNVILDNEYCTVTVTGYTDDEIWGYTANLFIVNKSDKNITVSVDNASVNGFMADPFWATEVYAGKCSFSSMSWSDSTFEENGITEAEEIEFVLRVSDADDWLADNYAEETITINP